MLKFRSYLAVVLALLMLLPSGLWAKDGPLQGPTQAAVLKIYVLSGDGAIHRPAVTALSDLVIEVRDLNDLPVEGAEVRFVLPETGPGGTFRGAPTYTTRTNSSGQAVAAGFESNGIEGRFQIVVEARSGERMGRQIVNNANSFRAGSFREDRPRKLTKRLLIIGAIAGAATAGLFLALRNDSSSGTASLTPGAVVIGASR